MRGWSALEVRTAMVVIRMTHTGYGYAITVGDYGIFYTKTTGRKSYAAVQQAQDAARERFPHAQ